MERLAVEGVRARSLQAQILRAKDEVRGEAPRELLARRRELAADLFARRSGRRATESVAAMAELEKLASELRQVEAQMREISPRYAELMLPEPLVLDDLQDRLIDDETMAMTETNLR